MDKKTKAILAEDDQAEAGYISPKCVELLTREQTAKALGVGADMVSNWTRRGCPTIYLGNKHKLGKGTRPRYILEDVKAWLAARSHAQSGKEVGA